MAKQSTIKNDPLEGAGPLDSVIPVAPQEHRPIQPVKGRGPAPTEPAGQKKEKLTVHVTHDLAERVKNAAYWNPRLTIAGIAERALAAVMDEIEREHGGPYPERDEELKGGRPIGSSRAANA